MKNLADRIKAFFIKKNKGDTTQTAPEGMCGNCWGHSEYEGEFYKIVKDKHLIPGDDIYESFISKIVDKHVATTHKHGDKYICTTCNEEL